MMKLLFTLSALLICSCTKDPEGLDPKECEDGKDNDLDGRYDCDDDGCAASTYCVNLARRTLEASRPAPSPDDKGGNDAVPETPALTFQVQGLMVQRAENGTDVSWADAEAYCERLGLADKSDWRLPTRAEAVTIIESGQLRNEPSYVMWTSTRRGENRATIVGISGAVNDISVRSKGQCRARCVRGSISN